jgi:hypothetical protein
MTCKYCNKRVVPKGCTTCCNSYCQEAAYHENSATVARGKRAKEEHRKRQYECEELARG